MIRIILIDDSTVYTAAFRHFLANKKDLSLIGNAGFDEDINELVSRLRPDIIFLAIPYHQKKALLIAEQLLNCFPGIKIICSGINLVNAAITRLLNAGCSSYINKITEPVQMEEIIHTVFNDPISVEYQMTINKAIYLKGTRIHPDPL